MNLFILILGSFFAILASATLSYVSMATMVGPWIAPAIVLASSIILKFRNNNANRSKINKELAIIQTIGSIGGIIGVGIGFSLPTLYFLDINAFNVLVKNPFYFSIFIGILCLSAGGLGIWLARTFANKFIIKDKLSFPVSKLIYNMITSQSQGKQAKKMFFGFSLSWIVCFLRDGFLHIKGIIPKVFYLFPSVLGNNFAISIMPMLWAIGFIAGSGIVLPLFVGLLSKYFVLWPLNNHSIYLPFKLFDALPQNDFITAFAAGLVISELFIGLLKYPKIVFSKSNFFLRFNFFEQFNLERIKKATKYILNPELILVLILSFILLTYFGFSLIAQILLLTFIVLATYQISYLGSKIGLITFGRFATFIMIPMMIMFKLNFTQITLLVVFFNVCAATASDLLFDYKVGQLCDIKFNKIHNYQWLGLIVTALTMGFFLWLLFNSFQIGSPELFAQRGKSRALLIQSLNFDWRILFLGFFYGVILKKIKISPTMVFGGILMPNSLTIGLAIGALLSRFSRDKNGSQDKFSLWSGVFAGESIWILITILIKICC